MTHLKELPMPLLKRLTPVAALAALAVLGACGGDTVGPEAVNPTDVAASVSDLSNAITSNAAFQSLGALSGQTFAAVSAFRASLPTRLSGSLTADRARFAATVAARRTAMNLFASARSPRGAQALFPANVLGKTYTWDAVQDQYVQGALTGAPANGVRFVLYSVDPVTGMPSETPLTTIGSVDLTDESTPQADVIGVLVRFGTQTVADYDISGVTTQTSVSLSAVGYLAGVTGGNRVDFDLETTLSALGGAGQLDVNYHVQGSNGVVIDIVVSGSDASLTIDVRVSHGRDNSIQLVGTGTATTVDLQIKYNGTVVATVTGDGDNPTFTGANGHALTQVEIAALLGIFVRAFEFVDELNGVFNPGYLIF